MFAGATGSGATNAMRALARDAVERGWALSTVAPKENAFGFLPGRHAPRNVGTREAVTDFILSTQPGNAEVPVLLLLDSANYYLTGDRDEHISEDAFMHLIRLLDDPYTGVAFRSHTPQLLPLACISRIRNWILTSPAPQTEELALLGPDLLVNTLKQGRGHSMCRTDLGVHPVETGLVTP